MNNSSIFIVEDDLRFSKTVEKALTHKGYKVLSAASVMEAKVKLQNQKFSCILLDLRLDGGSGESILTMLRGNKKEDNHRTPVIIMSGFLEPEVVKRILPSVQGMLVKPFDPAALFKKIEDVIGADNGQTKTGTNG